MPRWSRTDTISVRCHLRRALATVDSNSGAAVCRHPRMAMNGFCDAPIIAPSPMRRSSTLHPSLFSSGVSMGPLHTAQHGKLRSNQCCSVRTCVRRQRAALRDPRARHPVLAVRVPQRVVRQVRREGGHVLRSTVHEVSSQKLGDVGVKSCNSMLHRKGCRFVNLRY